jgi:CspA family cold shock protein
LKLDFRLCLAALPVLAAKQVTPKTDVSIVWAMHARAHPNPKQRLTQGKLQMATGTVKFFNTQKGFGFITPNDGSRDVFVHISAVERAGMSTLNEGQRVSYEIVTERGKQAASNLQNA